MAHKRITQDVMAELQRVPSESVVVPVLGPVMVRGMTGTERDAFEASLIKGRGRNREVNLANMRAKLIAFCAVDDEGVRLWSDADAEELGKGRADVLNRLYNVAARLSGITDEDAEELGKPSSQETSGSSSSGSLVN